MTSCVLSLIHQLGAFHPSVPGTIRFMAHLPYSLVARGVCLAFGSIQCFSNFSIAPESLDLKSVACKTVNLGQIEVFTFYDKKLKNNKLIIKNMTLIKESNSKYCQSVQGA